MQPAVLLSWIAVNNDPYERERGRLEFARQRDGALARGPTLTLVADAASPYRGRFSDAVFIRQGGPGGEAHAQRYEQLVCALAEHAPGLRPHEEVFEGADPTDHEAIFEFLRGLVPKIRQRFKGQELVIHISPGTPSMQTVWVLMAETGFIGRPYSVVKSFKAEDRQGGPAAVPVRIGLDTFYKRYLELRPQPATREDRIGWDPARFRSPGLRRLYEDARRVARLKVPVLLLGERGTGKTTLAAWIRTWSPWSRVGEHWKTVPCGQYTPETMRAELFGHARGAFTDAKVARSGLLKELDGDTLFLDEVGDISREMQRLLIKALEERTFQPLGAATMETSDFRLITATNLPLDTLQERLDPDFFDRISPFTLRVPALREIPEDLEWIWEEVLEEAARRAEVPIHYARLEEVHTRRVVEALAAHPLPGNLRDLFRIAWRFLAARADNDAPAKVDDAVGWALEGLDLGATRPPADGRLLARAFADGRPLPAALYEMGPIDPGPTFDELRRWFAVEVARVVRDERSEVGKVTTVKERTLREWRQKPAGESAE